jgi:DNA-binding transcriptional regulator GbsR (MarR family)
MTEMTDETVERFILHWGEMGTRWGINRTMAQIHALLFLSEEPLVAEEIAERLGVARSNVSGSLRELQSWGLIRPVHILGDRRTHFEALHDVWQMARTIVEHRKRRELDPTVQALRQCAHDAGSATYAAERLAELVAFFDAIDSAYRDLSGIPTEALRTAVRSRGRFRRLLTMIRGE